MRPVRSRTSSVESTMTMQNWEEALPPELQDKNLRLIGCEDYEIIPSIIDPTLIDAMSAYSSIDNSTAGSVACSERLQESRIRELEQDLVRQGLGNASDNRRRRILGGITEEELENIIAKTVEGTVAALKNKVASCSAAMSAFEKKLLGLENDIQILLGTLKRKVDSSQVEALIASAQSTAWTEITKELSELKGDLKPTLANMHASNNEDTWKNSFKHLENGMKLSEARLDKLEKGRISCLEMVVSTLHEQMERRVVCPSTRIERTSKSAVEKAPSENSSAQPETARVSPRVLLGSSSVAKSPTTQKQKTASLRLPAEAFQMSHSHSVPSFSTSATPRVAPAPLSSLPATPSRRLSQSYSTGCVSPQWSLGKMEGVVRLQSCPVQSALTPAGMSPACRSLHIKDAR